MSEIAAQIGSRLGSLTREFNVIAHNMANINTVGYKRRLNTFSKSLIAQDAGTIPETEGKANWNVSIDFTEDNSVSTGRNLDFALCGKGFFVVETPDGPLYTRNGTFHLNENGQIVDSAGRMVAGEAGAITIPSSITLTEISVSGEGNISAAGASFGKFKLVDFKDEENKLVSVGLNCYRAPEEIRPQAAEGLIVKQGFYESSNVKLVDELVDMIMVSRLYETNMKFISAKRDASKSLIGLAMA